MLSKVYEEEVRKKFYENAKKFGLSTEHSNILPFLEFVLNAKLEALTEINAIYQNFDIRRSNGIFLEMEAFKLGLSRESEEKTIIEAHINASDEGILYSGAVLSDGVLDFVLNEETKFRDGGDLKVTLTAKSPGYAYNVEDSHLLFSPDYVKGLVSLEVVRIKRKGRDTEEDTEFRARLFKHIESFTLRDSKAYYEILLTDIEEVKEAKVLRTPRGINSMDVVIRKVLSSSEDKRVLDLAKGAIDAVLPAFVDIKFSVAELVNVDIRIKINEIYNANELKTQIRESIALYFYKLKMGESFSVYELYNICGNGVNIISPIADLKPKEDQYFSETVIFEDEGESGV